MSALTPEEQRVLALMNEIDELTVPDPSAPQHPRNQDFLPGIDDDGKLFPMTEPLPSAEQQRADNVKLIAALEAQLAALKAKRAAQARGELPPDEPVTYSKRR